MKPPSNPYVLLAEDDRFLRRACETRLRQMGLTVATAVDGEQALRMIQEQAPAAILLDLLMPKITGIEVLRHLRAHQDTRDIPVLILTNSPRECDVEEIHRLGVSGYRVKAELSLQELGRCVAQLLAPKE